MEEDRLCNEEKVGSDKKFKMKGKLLSRIVI